MKSIRVLPRVLPGAFALGFGLILLLVAWPAAAQCPFGSIQSRVQPNTSTPWTQTLTVGAGQSFRVGGFYNHTGLLDTSGNVHLQLTGPNGYVNYPANGSFVSTTTAGSYTLRAYCGSLNDYASVNVTSTCPYQSIQVRVQPNTSTPWTSTLTIQGGQSFRVGGFYNNTGQLAPNGIALRVTGPGGFSQSPANGVYVTTTLSGQYTVTGTCGTLTGTATVTASSVAGGTNPKRFIHGMGVAWGSQWSQLTSDATRRAWDRANLDQIVAAGATNTHVSFDWVGIETSRGVYDWSYADHQVVEAEKRGLEMFAYTGNTPNWALASRLANPTVRVCSGKPNNPLLPPGETTQGIADFQNFHRTLAQRYCGRVKYYEFWNEPNGCWWMSCGCGDQTDAQKAEYARWLQRWYAAMKQGCADVVLSVGGLDCNWGSDPNSAAPWCIDWMQKLYDNGGGSSFDAVALHPYGYAGDLQVALQNNKTLNWTVINGVTSLLASRGQSSKQLWLDEWGFNTTNDTLKGQLVQATLYTLQSQYPNVFQARYLTITDLPSGDAYGLADSSTSLQTVTPRGSWSRFRDVALGSNTQRLPLWNPGMEYQGQPPSPQYTHPIPSWGPNGAWAFHIQYPRSGNGVLGRKFGYYSAGTSETFGQILNATFQPGRTYRFKASVHGGGDNTGTLPVQIGYQDTSGLFQPLTTVPVSLTSAWNDISGASYTTPSSGLPNGRPIWVRFGTGGSTDAWFDNLIVTVSPPQ